MKCRIGLFILFQRNSKKFTIYFPYLYSSSMHMYDRFFNEIIGLWVSFKFKQKLIIKRKIWILSSNLLHIFEKLDTKNAYSPIIQFFSFLLSNRPRYFVFSFTLTFCNWENGSLVNVCLKIKCFIETYVFMLQGLWRIKNLFAISYSKI